MKQCCDKLNDILNVKNKSKKKMLKNDFFDCVIFFMKKLQEERLTIAMMDEKKDMYLNIITKYVEEKSKRPTLTGQSVTVGKIGERRNLFEEIWQKSIADDGLKNQKPTSVEVSLAYLKSGSNCPIAGDSLDENTRVEHGDAKSKSSKTKFNLVSERGNRWKSNLSLDQVNKIRDYQMANQLD